MINKLWRQLLWSLIYIKKLKKLKLSYMSKFLMIFVKYTNLLLTINSLSFILKWWTKKSWRKNFWNRTIKFLEFIIVSLYHTRWLTNLIRLCIMPMNQENTIYNCLDHRGFKKRLKILKVMELLKCFKKTMYKHYSILKNLSCFIKMSMTINNLSNNNTLRYSIKFVLVCFIQTLKT